MSTPNTDILIPFHSTREFPTESHLDMCIETLCQTTHNYRLILVDDASDDVGREHIDKIARQFPESVLLHTYKQRWFTRAVNLGLRLVKTLWCVELNSDVTLEAGWLEELYEVKEELEKVGGKVGLVGSVYSPEDPRRYIVTHAPDYVTGHTWLCNMQAMKQIGATRGTPDDYLDEINPLAIHIRSDNYICYDMNRLGWVTVIAHKSKVNHIAGKSWGHQLHRIPRSVSEVNFNYGN